MLHAPSSLQHALCSLRNLAPVGRRAARYEIGGLDLVVQEGHQRLRFTLALCTRVP
jgi:hypothetical protein